MTFDEFYKQAHEIREKLRYAQEAVRTGNNANAYRYMEQVEDRVTALKDECVRWSKEV